MKKPRTYRKQTNKRVKVPSYYLVGIRDDRPMSDVDRRTLEEMRNANKALDKIPFPEVTQHDNHKLYVEFTLFVMAVIGLIIFVILLDTGVL